jgi:hypothetical protein
MSVFRVPAELIENQRLLFAQVLLSEGRKAKLRFVVGLLLLLLLLLLLSNNFIAGDTVSSLFFFFFFFFFFFLRLLLLLLRAQVQEIQKFEVRRQLCSKLQLAMLHWFALIFLVDSLLDDFAKCILYSILL